VLTAVVAIIALALLLEITGTDQRSTPANVAAASLSRADVAQIAKRVERIRHLRFVHPVRPLFVSHAEAAQMIAAEARGDYPVSAQRSDEEALKLLGLMRPPESLTKASTAVDREQILGFYDDRRRRLVVVREAHASRALLEITLAHELTHALEDQRFGFHTRRGVTDDVALSVSALAEGSATEVMIEYARRYFRAGDALSVLAATSQPTTKLPEYVEKSLLFPYEAGLAFVEFFRGESGSWRPLDAIVRLRPPRSVEQVLHPDKYASGERPVPMRIPDLASTLGPGWSRTGTSTVGEFDLRMIFEIVGGSPDEAAAAGWGGGQFALWRQGGFGGESCAAPCIARDVGVMRLAWDTRSDRRVAEDALGKAFEKGLRAKRSSLGGGVGLWSSRGGAIALAGEGKQTAVVLAPNAQLAARVLDRLRNTGAVLPVRGRELR
jgi:hypothetical protein